MAKIINFFGADHKVGTTMIVQAIADSISEQNPDVKVLILHLDGKEGLDYTSVQAKTIDTIFPSLITSMTKQGEVDALVANEKNIYSLGGSKSNDFSVRYTPECAKCVIDLVANEYDVILIDSGAAMDTNGLAIGAFQYPCVNILVTDQHAGTLMHFNNVRGTTVDRINAKISGIIINKFTWFTGSFLGTQDQVEARYGIGNSFLVSEAPEEVALQAEFNRKSLVFYKKAKAFKKDIEKLVISFNLLSRG